MVTYYIKIVFLQYLLKNEKIIFGKLNIFRILHFFPKNLIQNIMIIFKKKSKSVQPFLRSFNEQHFIFVIKIYNVHCP